MEQKQMQQQSQEIKKLIFEYYVPFTNTQVDHAKDLDEVMPMYELIKNNDNYSKTSGNLRQYYKNHPNINITNSESFRCNASTKVLVLNILKQLYYRNT